MEKIAKNCGVCDWYCCTKTLEENHHRRLFKTAKNIQSSLACVQPNSPFYGQYRKRNNRACESFLNHINTENSDFDAGSIEVEQLRLVNLYREDYLRREAISELPSKPIMYLGRVPKKVDDIEGYIGG